MAQLIALLIAGGLGILAFLYALIIVILFFKLLLQIFVFSVPILYKLAVWAFMIWLLVTYAPPVFEFIYDLGERVFYFIYDLLLPRKDQVAMIFNSAMS